MKLRLRIYSLLVNRVPGIATRYHALHDNSSGINKVFSWAYLLWLNLAFHLLHIRSVGEMPEGEFYEEKKLLIDRSESEAAQLAFELSRLSDVVEKLSGYDVVSFDIFDTLLFRPFFEPMDVFYLMGDVLGFADFRRIRMMAEQKAREEMMEREGHSEVTLREIWEYLSRETGLSAIEGMELEMETEKKLCYANPYMLSVWNALLELRKKNEKPEIIIVSDMYLSTDFLMRLLEERGFIGASKVYVSNAYRMSKADGSLYEVVKADNVGKRMIHVGDHPISDQRNAAAAGISLLPYPEIRRAALSYRPFDMSYMIGSAYRGVIQNSLYSGTASYPMTYEYGFIYGGLFVLGYCHFIHEEYLRCGYDKVLFLSRDGDIISKVFSKLYPDVPIAYVYWSRKAATKLMAGMDKYDYLRRFIDHKVNLGYTIESVFKSMELSFLSGELATVGLRKDMLLTDRNQQILRSYVEHHWNAVIGFYAKQQDAACRYYRDVLSGCQRAVAVDIGWAGSGAMSLSRLVRDVWKIPCQITGIIAGTNTIHNAEPDASEPFLQSGKLVAYLYSQAHNRDLLKLHDLNKGDNIYWELLLASPTPQFLGFYPDGLHFGKQDVDPAGAKEIQQGILDFVEEYTTRFKDYPYMMHISGRDAYAPMIAAMSHNRAYLKEIGKRFKMDVNLE